MDQLTLDPEPPPVAAYAGGITFEVAGLPAPQGSLKSFRAKSGAVITKDSNPRTKPWKEAVTADASAAVHAAGLTHPAWRDGPIRVAVTFRLGRPKHHYGARGLLPSAPPFPITTPDLDKLARAILDALTGIAYRDDSQVVVLEVEKVFADVLRTTVNVRPAR